VTYLGFGCGSLMQIPIASQRRRLLEVAFDLGMRHFDVARMYGLGQAEIELGQFAKGRRDQLTIATKCGIDLPVGMQRVGFVHQSARFIFRYFPTLKSLVQRSRVAPVYQRPLFTADYIRKSLEDSLRALNTHYVDYFFLHEPTFERLLPETVSVLESLRLEGKILKFGIAGFWSQIGTMSPQGQSLPYVIQTEAFIPKAVTITPQFIFGLISQGMIRLSILSQDQRIALGKMMGYDLEEDQEKILLLISYITSKYPDVKVIGSSTDTERLKMLHTLFGRRRKLSEFQRIQLETMCDI